MSHPNFTLEPGCYVDGNSMNVDEFNREVVYLAVEEGMVLSVEDDKTLSGEDDDEDSSQYLSDLADEAVDFLNSIKEGDMAIPEGWFWTIDESCLMLMEGDAE